MELKIKRLPHAAGLPLPTYQSVGAAGFDLLAAVPADTPTTLPPGGRALIPTGLAVEIAAGYEAQTRPRSGLALKHGVTVLNAPGTIDSDYRGEVGIILINHGDAPFVVRRGDRIAQMVVAPAPQARLMEVDHLSSTARDAGGFGSTGIRTDVS
ncbi:dUTP pyrophosphatase [Rhodoblastus acidophilus]|nr:dUTP pyrophosphatase [Rhodoblastus acidophilus]